MNTLSKLTDLGREIAAATRTVQENVAELREQIEAKRAELLHAQNAPYTRDEIRTSVRRWVAEQGQFWKSNHAPDLVHTFGSPHNPRPPWNAATPVTWGALCRYCPEVAAGIIADMDSQEYEAGPSSVERPAVVARLSRELTEIEGEEERAIADAAAAGVDIKHRAEVVERRQSEARAQQLTDQAEAARRAGEAVVNEHHGGRRSTPSPYIAARRSHVE